MVTVNAEEISVETQELELGGSKQDADGLLLHLIRIIALYLFAFLSQTSKLEMTDVELAIFVSNAATLDLLDEQTKELRYRLHAVLLVWIQSEMNSSQFDGLQEQLALVVIARLFRQQRATAATQCRVLAALLTSYMTRLKTPLVNCERSGMLSSTLEYLLAKEKDLTNKEPVPLSMLYPLVNAVDLVSIEERECLDALMNVLRWLTLHDQSQTIFILFANKYHAKIIGMTDENDGNSNVSNSDEMGVCFVQMLVRYSDHIFRRDFQFQDIVPTLSYSDIEDFDISSEDGRTQSHQQSNNSNNNLSAEDLEKLIDAKTNSSDIKPTIPDEVSNLEQEVVQRKDAVVVAKENAESHSKSRSLRKRKKREEKAVALPVKNTCRARSCSEPTHEAEFEDEQLQWEYEEPLPAVMCVSIAAAAAAVICVYFN